MSSPTIKFIKSPSVSVTNGSKIVTLTGSVDAYHVYDGTAIFIGSHQPVEGFSGTTVDGSGNSTITLKNTWTLPTVTAEPLVAFNSNEGLPEAIRRARSIGDLTLALMTNFETVLNSTSSSVSIDIDGVPTNFVPYQYLANQFAASQANMDSQINTLVGSISAMTKAEFFALAEQCKSQSAGSGFQEWGKHRTSLPSNHPINEGIWTNTTVSSALNMSIGGVLPSGVGGKSLSDQGIVSVNGNLLRLDSISVDGGANWQANIIKFPDAPDGTKTYDSSTGTVTQHASAAIAFAAETATNKVITSRQDFVFIECWHEKISDKDVVYPLGNVQYGGTTYEGITTYITTFLEPTVPQGYNAFGEWDSVSTGRGRSWSTLTDAEKAIFIQNPENNIYSDEGELIQVRYRVRVVEGLGDEWGSVLAGASAQSWFYSNGSFNTVQPRGQKLTVEDFGVSQTLVGLGTTHPANSKSLGRLSLRNNVSLTDGVAHNKELSVIPIALVQRRNQGAYHPTFNPNGTRSWWQAASAGRAAWYDSDITPMPTGTSDCFMYSENPADSGKVATNSGYIGERTDRPDTKFYDAIYASDVKDLRMSAKKLPLKEIREKYKRMAIAGEVRGFEGVPFTFASTVSTIAADPFNATINGRSVRLYRLSITKISGDWDIDSTNGTFTACGLVTGGVTYIGLGVLSGNGTNVDMMFDTGLPLPPVANGAAIDAIIFSAYKISQTHKQANPTWTDIIGSPANIAATFPDGVEGQWIPVIPEAVSKVFPLNRKVLSADLDRRYSNNNGASWSDLSGQHDATSNTYTGFSSASWVALLHYETQAHFTKDDVNSKVLDLGGVFATGDVFGEEFLTSGLIGKVPTSRLWTARYEAGEVKGVGLNKGYLSSSGAGILHDPAVITVIGEGAAVKTLDYLSHDNNVAKLCYAYKEMVWGATAFASAPDITMSTPMNAHANGVMVHMTNGEWRGYYVVMQQLSGSSYDSVANDGRLVLVDGDIRYKLNDSVVLKRVAREGSWGDNNQFEIIGNQSTLTDDNGNPALYGMASFDTQYFINEE